MKRSSCGVCGSSVDEREERKSDFHIETYSLSLSLFAVSSTALLTHSVKLATSSQWDHVAMIVQSQRRPDHLRLFEATMEVCVCACVCVCVHE